MGAADHRDRAGRLRDADRPGVLRLCRVRPFPARNSGRGRHPHDPSFLLQIPRRRKDRGRAEGRSRPCCLPNVFPASPRSRMAWPSARPSRRSAGSRRRRERRRCAPCLPNSNGCASHAAAITGICNSTALAVATSQAALIEESLLRLSCEVASTVICSARSNPGGVACDLSARMPPSCRARSRISRKRLRSASSDAALFQRASSTVSKRLGS